ncbi:trypsin-like serine peptidase [Embleya scabrispora]|uniref:trypsin-like serine peptidase n=1 Tax=Embleya scabrispora TaxID=159449 RepID=UPI00117D5ED8|nr:trypsin-like serine protease [Embleya scabrispora]
MPVPVDAPDENGYQLTADPYGGATWSRVTGKMFVIDDASAQACSGAVIRSTHRNLVLTAAHCVYDQKTRKWKGADELSFVPARGEDSTGRNKPVDQEKYGVWTRKKAYIPPEYEDGSSAKATHPDHYDIAVFTVEDHAKSQGGSIDKPIEDVVGGLDPQVVPAGGSVQGRLVGYPGPPRYADEDEATQRYCALGVWKAGTDASSDLRNEQACLGYDGNSGGPVVVRDAKDAGVWRVVGVLNVVWIKGSWHATGAAPVSDALTALIARATKDG